MDCRNTRLIRPSTDSLLRQDQRTQEAVCQLAYAKRKEDVLEAQRFADKMNGC
jgi:hypothetical protein